MQLNRIHHVAIIVSQYEKAREFYVEKLGFEILRENYRPEKGDYKLDLRLGDCELEIFGVTNPPRRVTNPEACGLVTRSILERRDRPTCIFYPDDIALLGGMTEIERWGLRIPEDISVAGYDGIKLSRFLRPELTTLCQDTQAMGSEAARLLTQAIEENKAFMPQVVMVPGSLQPGGTVAKLHSQSTGIEAGNKRY